MRTSAILSAGLAALVSAAPLESRADLPGTFQVTKFSYGCTSTCDWSFNVTVSGTAANHPALTTPVTCSGSLTDQDYVACSSTGNNQAVSAYIKKSNNNLKLQYTVNQPRKGATYNYFGFTHVNAQTSGLAQPKKFSVAETRATAVA